MLARPAVGEEDPVTDLLAAIAVLLPVTVIIGFGLLLDRRIHRLDRRLAAVERPAAAAAGATATAGAALAAGVGRRLAGQRVRKDDADPVDVPQGLPTRSARNRTAGAAASNAAGAADSPDAGPVGDGEPVRGAAAGDDEAVRRAAAELASLVTKLARIAGDRPGNESAERALGEVQRRIDRLRDQLREGPAGGPSLVTPRVPAEPDEPAQPGVPAVPAEPAVPTEPAVPAQRSVSDRTGAG